MAIGGMTVNEDNTEGASQGIQRAIDRALETIGLLAEGYAKRACPVGTPESTGIPHYQGGTLRDSITYEVSGDSVYIGTNVEYAPYVELGTWKMQAQPFLRPAATEHGSTYRSILKRNLEEG